MELYVVCGLKREIYQKNILTKTIVTQQKVLSFENIRSLKFEVHSLLLPQVILPIRSNPGSNNQEAVLSVMKQVCKLTEGVASVSYIIHFLSSFFC